MTSLTLSYSSISFSKINWKAYCLCAFLIALSLAIFYVAEVNYMIKGSYLIKGYQKQIDSLSQENGDKTQEMSFEKVKEVKYIQILEASFVSANRDNMR